jgi:hypothetical protein
MLPSKSIGTALVVAGALAFGRVAARRALRRMVWKRMAKAVELRPRRMVWKAAPAGPADTFDRIAARLRPVVVGCTAPRGLVKRVASTHRRIERDVWPNKPDEPAAGLHAQRGVPRIRIPRTWR